MSLKILLIEDSKTIGTKVVDLLEAEGWIITWVMSGAKALEVMKSNSFDLALMDVVLEDMTGYQLYSQVDLSKVSNNVIFLTGLTNQDDLNRAFELGASDYIRKPFNDEELILRVRRNLRTLESRKEIQHQRDRLQHFFDNSDILVQSINADSNLVYVNNCWREKLGYSQEDLDSGLSMFDIIKESEQEHCENIFYRVIKGEHTPAFRTVFISKEGDEIVVEGSVISYQDQGVNFTQGIFVDITEKEQRDSQILRLSQAMEQSGAPVFMTDVHGIINFVNSGFTESTGYTMEDLRGNSPSYFKSGIHDKAFYKKLWETVLTGESWTGEICNKHKNGELVWYSVSISPVFNKDGEVSSYICVEENISKRKQIEESLRDALETQKQISEIKSGVVAVASHQFRTPFTILQSNLDLIRIVMDKMPEGNSRNTLDKCINRMQGEIKHMVTLMDDVLNMAKTDAGELQYQPENIDLIENTTKVVETFNQIQPDGRTIKIVVSGKEKMVETDPKLLENALSNLIGNAFKYSVGAADPELHINFEANRVQLEVIDFGIGIDPYDQNKLFTPFFRGRNADAVEGSGLGLNIAKNCIDKMGGYIEMESQSGIGSKFGFKIPYIVV